EEGADHGVLLGLGAVGSAGTVGGVDHGARVVDVELGHVGQGLPVGAALVLQALQRRLGLGLGGAGRGGLGQALGGGDDLGVDRGEGGVGAGDPGVAVLRRFLGLELEVGIGERLGARLGAELRLVAAGDVEELGGADD